LYLVFVGGIKRNLSHFLVTFTHQLHRARGQLDALEQGRLGGITSHVPLRQRAPSVRSAERGTQAGPGAAGGCTHLEHSNVILTTLEDSSVAEPGDVGQGHPGVRALVERGSWRRHV
jgi:hypothetical protein